MEKNKKIQVVIIIILLLVACGLGGYCIYLNKLDNNKQKPNIQEPTDITEPSEISVNTKSDYAFLKLENNKENMIYSPLSINYAFSMLSLGADNNTAKELNDVFGQSNFKDYKNIDNVLSIANSIFIRDIYKDTIKQSYINDIQNKFNGMVEIKYDNFESVEIINKWVSEKTFELIPDILKEGDINVESKVILANALAIKMKWANTFDTSSTHGKTFYLEDGQEYNATTLNQETHKDNISYYEDEKTTALSMDLEKINNTQLEFLAIMPENLSDYIANFQSEQIDKIDSKLIKASDEKNGISINIPKFKFDYQLKLKEDLINLGIKDVFDSEKADLSKIGDTGLFVDNCLHKATIDFSEEGIKAAASTVIVAKDSIGIVDENAPKEININKPFMFLIRDKESKNIWFVGTVYKPNSWLEDQAKYTIE